MPMWGINLGKRSDYGFKVAFLRKNGYIERVGSRKTGYWKYYEKPIP